MIEPASSFPDLLSNLSRFLMENASSLPERTREQVVASIGHPSPVVRIVDTAEALYAAKTELTKEGRDIAAQLAQFAAVNGFHGMSERGQQIAQAMNRMGGYKAPAGVTWPAADQDPAPLERFAPAEESTDGMLPAPAGGGADAPTSE